MKELSYINNPNSLFRKYSKLVTWVGKTMVNSDIVLYLPNGYIKKLDEKTYKMEIYTRPVNAKALYPALIAIDNLSYQLNSFKDAMEVMWWYLNRGKMPSILRGTHFETSTFNPDANPETTSVDGNVGRTNGSGESFSTIRGGAGTAASDSSTNDIHIGRLTAHPTSNPNYQELVRGIFLFDSSALGNSIISAATISLFVRQSNGALVNAWNITSSNPASNTAVVAGDYAVAGFGSTDFITSDPSYSGLTLLQYTDQTLNASGRDNISKFGISKFGTRPSVDIDNSAPTWSAGADSFLTVDMADGTNKPKLDVTFTRVGGGALFL